MGQSDGSTGMIEPIFNEYTAYPLCANDSIANLRFDTLIGLLKHLEVYGVKRVRYENSIHDIPFLDGISLGDYCQNFLRNRTSSNAKQQVNALFLYSRIKKPFVKEGEADFPDNMEGAKYLRKTSVFEREFDCPLSLIVAYSLNTFVVGFDNDVGDSCRLSIIRSCAKAGNGKTTSECVDVPCVCKENNCFENMRFVELMSSQNDLPVPEYSDVHKTRMFNLPGHHGLKECKEHGEDLLKTPYVKDVLSSRAFDPKENNYIHKINSDGSIEVRLYWTRLGYGLLISTTAENVVQTHWIAKWLDNKYGKRS